MSEAERLLRILLIKSRVHFLIKTMKSLESQNTHKHDSYTRAAGKKVTNQV